MRNKKIQKSIWKRWYMIVLYVFIGIIIINGFLPNDATNNNQQQDDSQMNFCSSSWQCSSWSECSSSGTETRTCRDVNNCGSVSGKPSESRSCAEETNRNIEEKIKQDIVKELGSSNRKVEKVRRITIINQAVSIEYNADDNIKSSWVGDGINMDARDVFKMVFTKYPEVKQVGIKAFFPLVDKYGQEEDEQVTTIMMTRETADKVNWENIYFSNIPSIADKYYMHPALME